MSFNPTSTEKPTIGSLFSGYGGLDRAVEDVFDAVTVWHSQYEPPTEKQPNPSQAPSKVLAAHWDVPNHGDITRIDWAAVQPVDIICAGYPCQPDSLAGKGLSTDDERYLWPEVARAIRVLGPRLVVLENVFGHLVRGFAGVVGALAELGYDARWTTLRAVDVGAPHRRERLFVIAYPGGGGWDGRPWELGSGGRNESENSSDVAADPDHAADDRQRSRPELGQGSGETVGGDKDPAWFESISMSWTRGATRLPWGAYEPAIRRWERILGRAAPDPTELAPKGGQRLSPRFVEWMMGLPAGWVTDVPGISRNDQLKMLGNGVVPQQAVAALDALLALSGVPGVL